MKALREKRARDVMSLPQDAAQPHQPQGLTEAEKPSDPTANPVIRQEILGLRGSIDNIDASLMYLLAERFKCTKRVGELKAQAGIAASDPDREGRQIQRLTEIAQSAGLDTEFAQQFREFIVAEAIRRHKLIAAELGETSPLDTVS